MQTRNAIRTFRNLLAGLAVAALGLGLAACSDTSSDEPAVETTAAEEQAADNAAQQAVAVAYQGLAEDSYRLESAMTVNGADFMTMTTSVEGENFQSTQDLLMSALIEAAGEEVDPAMADLFGDIHSETVVFDGTAYLRLNGGMFAGLSDTYGEDAWYTIDLAGESDLASIYQQVGGLDLSHMTESILGSLEDVKETGANTYTGTLAADSEAVGAFAAAAGTDAAAFADGVEVTVVLDDAGLLESMELTVPEQDGLTLAMTSAVTETGADYGVAVPDSGDLVPLEEAMASLQENM